jgi:hypothetical protein
MKTLVWACLLTLFSLWACGGDGQDEPGDACCDLNQDHLVDSTVDPAQDFPAEEAQDGTDGGEDAPDAGVPDLLPDGLPDGETACAAAGGYCTTYPIVPDACPSCEDREGTHYVLASGTDTAMGCPTEGLGPGAWCCIPHDPPDESACESGGDECYPLLGPDPCPMCWSAEEGSGDKCPYPTASPDFFASTTVLWDSEGVLARGTAIASHGYRGGPFVGGGRSRCFRAPWPP